MKSSDGRLSIQASLKRDPKHERYLRYYAPYFSQEEHQEILRLLEKIKEKHGIEYEEIPIGKREWYDKIPKISELEVYRNHLIPCSRLIKINDPYEMTARRKFKTRSGHIFVSGSIAVMENEKVLWATHEKEFLEYILDGNVTIDSFKSDRAIKEGDIHTQLLSLMEEKNIPDPEIREKIWLREIATGFRRVGISEHDIQLGIVKYGGYIEYNLVSKSSYRAYLQKELTSKYGFGSPLHIIFADFVVLSKENWVIEGKEELNYEAIGQVLVYKDLLEEDYPRLGSLRMGIACFEGNMRLERTCENYGINIFNFGEIMH